MKYFRITEKQVSDLTDLNILLHICCITCLFKENLTDPVKEYLLIPFLSLPEITK